MALILNGTLGLSDVDGSAATPAIRGTDTNTGIFFPAADTIAFAEGGVESARFDSAGNFGLGVTPSAWGLWGSVLQGNPYALTGFNNGSGNVQAALWCNSFRNSGGTNVYYSNGAASQYVQASGIHAWNIAPSGTAGNAISFTQAMTLTATGDTDLKLTTANTGSGATDGLLIRVNSTGTESYLWNYENGALVFGTNNTERARIDSSGNLLVGSTVASVTSGLGFKFIWGGSGTNPFMGIVTDQSTNGNANYHLYSTGAGAYRFYVGNGGTIFATSTSISAISDRTLKENIRDLETGLTEVMALKPRRFDWKNGDAQNVAGFVAQEVEEVLPELVTEYKYSDTETKKSLKMGDILPTLVKAIQEQQALINAQQAALQTLTAQVAALDARLISLEGTQP